MAAAAAHFKKLNELWATITSLDVDSSEEEFNKFASFFAPDGLAYFAGMANPASKGREELIAGLQQILPTWKTTERRVKTMGISQDTNTIFAEVELKIDVKGQIVDPLHEVEIAEFDADGLIKNYRAHTDPVPVLRILGAA
jgi:hypothetical protein